MNDGAALHVQTGPGQRSGTRDGIALELHIHSDLFRWASWPSPHPPVHLLSHTPHHHPHQCLLHRRLHHPHTFVRVSTRYPRCLVNHGLTPLQSGCVIPDRSPLPWRTCEET